MSEPSRPTAPPTKVQPTFLKKTMVYLGIRVYCPVCGKGAEPAIQQTCRACTASLKVEAPAPKGAMADPPRPAAAPTTKQSGGALGVGIGAALLCIVIGAAVGAALIVGGTLLYNHFALTNYLCNTVGGEYAQQGSTGTAVSCAGNGFAADMGQLMKWLGIVIIVGGVLLGLVLAVAASNGPKKSPTKTAPLKSGVVGNPRPTSEAKEPAQHPDNVVTSACSQCGAEFTRIYTGHTCLDCGAPLQAVT